MKVRKAIILAAGLGTRLRPASLAVPKELFPLGRQPVIHHVVDELIAAGVSAIRILTRDGKQAIEDYFNTVRPEADISFQVQSAPWGTGGAVNQMYDFVQDEPFFVSYGDAVIFTESRQSLLEKMQKSYDSLNPAAIIALWQVLPNDVSKYGIVSLGTEHEPGVFAVTGLVEKPSPEASPGLNALAARFLFTSEIFPHLRGQKESATGEVLLTDAILSLITARHRVLGIPLAPGQRRYDIGNFPSYYGAFLAYAQQDPEFRPE